MKKLDAISVRVDEPLKKRLEAVAKQVRLDKATLIRLAIQGLVDEAEARGGSLTVPPSFELKIVAKARK